MEKLHYKIFLMQKEMHLTSTHIVGFENTIVQQCFELVNSFEKLEDALNWRKENQNFEGQYSIVACY